MTEDAIKSAVKCAEYIIDLEAENFEEFVENGNDPEDHIYYHACQVLDI